jgi:hypothetical protein
MRQCSSQEMSEYSPALWSCPESIATIWFSVSGLELLLLVGLESSVKKIITMKIKGHMSDGYSPDMTAISSFDLRR